MVHRYIALALFAAAPALANPLLRAEKRDTNACYFNEKGEQVCITPTETIDAKKRDTQACYFNEEGEQVCVTPTEVIGAEKRATQACYFNEKGEQICVEPWALPSDAPLADLAEKLGLSPTDSE